MRGNILYQTDATLINKNPLRYRGYIYDTDTGFYYLQSRYYDPKIGRFLNADSYASTGQGFIGYNMYAYCNNNPVNCSDKSGHAREIEIGSFGGGGAGTYGILKLLTETIPAAVAGLSAYAASQLNEQAESESKPITKPWLLPDAPRTHHIVPKLAKKARPAQAILMKNNVNVFTDPHNLVVIPHSFHKSMHTNKYYQYINDNLSECQSTADVYLTLDRLKAEIVIAARGGPIPWA